MLLIPSDYHTGKDTLTYEYPWITPDAMTFLDLYIQKGMSAIDFGTGGSSIFFARRCAHVIAMDNNTKWVADTRGAIEKKGIKNISLYDVSTIDECKMLSASHHDVCLVDCCDISRYDLAVWMQDRCDCIAIDNYAAPYCFNVSDTFDKAKWDILTFDDLHWVGNGTRIFLRRK